MIDRRHCRDPVKPLRITVYDLRSTLSRPLTNQSRRGYAGIRSWRDVPCLHGFLTLSVSVMYSMMGMPQELSKTLVVMDDAIPRASGFEGEEDSSRTEGVKTTGEWGRGSRNPKRQKMVFVSNMLRSRRTGNKRPVLSSLSGVSLLRGFDGSA
ncbi:hypothetical protein LZ30DRAFT_203039 [Colletotrichum cereale]|nr:hypothetical protein LZ30DRAFT_203039 [Colletotrichum cereale]